MQASTKTLWEQIAEVGATKLASQLSDSEAIRLTNQYGTHNYKPLPVNLVDGRGGEAWDGTGKRYIDCVGAYSALAHGHASTAIIDAMKAQLERISLASRAVFTSELALFLEGITQYCDLDMACPMNTGAEAVETAIKIARKWAYTVKGVPHDKAEIIVCQDNFHGRTTTIVGFSTEPGYKANFGPFTPGFKIIPFGDIDALKAAITPNTAAFLCEPIQAEGGIIIPPTGWMAQVRQLCDESNVLLVWDEVQTGFARTGKRFAWQWEDAKPDIIAVGKPLGGGLLPVAAAVGKHDVMNVFQPGDHGSTFGGNPLACIVALTALAEMEIQGFAEMSRVKGERLLQGLKQLNSPHVIDLRGRGLLVGLEVAEGTDTTKLTANLLEEGILTKETRNRTFRFTPPIVIEDHLIDEIVERVGSALARL